MSKLFYVIGASGAGKDTLMNYARQQINGTENIIFAHRYITRPPFAGGENHVSLSHAEFELRIKMNLLALHWESHGNYYGLGNEINNWLEAGFNVVINGSRQYLPTAREIFPDLEVILIDASPEIISQRLASRGREDAAEIQKRLVRTAEITTDLQNCTTILNDTTVEEAGNRVIEIICQTHTPVAPVQTPTLEGA